MQLRSIIHAFRHFSHSNKRQDNLSRQRIFQNVQGSFIKVLATGKESSASIAKSMILGLSRFILRAITASIYLTGRNNVNLITGLSSDSNQAAQEEVSKLNPLLAVLKQI